jgi:hypothetical protein
MGVTQRGTPRGTNFHTEAEEANYPVMGSEAVRHQPISKATGEPKLTKAGNPKIVLKFPGTIDFKDPKNIVAATANFAHAIESSPPQYVEEGKLWYPKANEEVQRSLSTRGFLGASSDRNLSASGILASVSPNTDWDSRNVQALTAVKSLGGKHWDAIVKGQPTRRSAHRLDYNDAMTRLSSTALSNAKLPELQKIGRLVQGEHPDDVLDRRTSPKTNSFMHNIADPSSNYVTLDGRAYDTLTNRSRPWEFGRGLSKAALPSGKSTRYEDVSHIVGAVARSMDMDPSAAQAVAWTHVKYGIEQQDRTRKQGPGRRGQPYFHPMTGEPILHMSGQFNG